MTPAEYRAELTRALSALDLDAVAKAAHVLDTARYEWRVVYTAGNGGSAATASHFVNDLCKAASLNPAHHPFRAVCLTDNVPLLTAWANDDLYTEALADILKCGLRGDVLVAISTSGKSPNLINAALTAHEQGMIVLALTGQAPNLLTDVADVVVSVPTASVPVCEDVHLVVCHMLTELLAKGVRQ